MRSKKYICGVEILKGDDAWALFTSCAQGDVFTVKDLLAKDPRLVNAQFWYRFPIHMAVFAGNSKTVQLLLAKGADPGQSSYTYDSWDKLLQYARERGYEQIESLLQRAMNKRFHYAPDFELLKEAILTRESRKITAVLRSHPHLARSSDALGNNALHWAVITRQLGWIKRFVEQGTPIDAQRADGQSPVLLAVNGAMDYWYRAMRGRSHRSLRNTSVMVGSLLALGANYNIAVAAAVGDQERVEQLIRTDARLAKQLDSARISPLSHAAREGHLHIVHLLLEHGADPNAPEDAAPLGRALFEACRSNHVQVAELLLKHGADPNAGTDSNECCLTIGRIYHGENAKPVENLLRQHGARTPPYRMSVDELKQAIRSRDEVTQHEEFLGTVLGKGDSELLDLYLDADPEVLQRLHFGNGVAYPQSTAIVRKLLDRGLDPNQRDWLGKTLLHACAENGNHATATLLLRAGADIHARDFEFQGTPLAAAVRCSGQENNPQQALRRRRVIELLLRRGAATNLPGDQSWSTPLAWAIRLKREELAELLKQHGAR